MEATRTITKQKDCQRCKSNVTAVLVRNIIANGSSQVYWQCGRCKKSIDSPPKWISHDLLHASNIDPETLPVVQNYSGLQVCAVCGQPGTEYHHFAPRWLFGEEADKWPTAYLCLKHHHEWHEKVDQVRRTHGRQ